MFSLLLAVVDDLLSTAETDRKRRALAARLGWSDETIRNEARAYEGANQPYKAKVDDLDWRFEVEYPVRRLLAYGWDDERRDTRIWLDEETADRGMEWYRNFARWYRREPESQPIVLVEDVHGELEGIWDGWHRSAVAVAAGMKTVPAIVGTRRWGRSVKERQDLAIAHYGETHDPGCVGFILSDGRWVDFSEGSGFRAQDHRNICWLVPPDEQAALARRPGEEPERVYVMNHWMDTTQAIRVSLGSRNYAMVDLPDGAEATLAVLRDPMLLGRWVRHGGEFDLTWRGKNHSNLSLRELGKELRLIRDEATAEVENNKNKK